MTDLATFSPDLPELRLLAQFVGIAPSRLAAAFSDPAHLFEHITLDELQRFKENCDRVGALMVDMAASMAAGLPALQKGWS